MISFIAKFRQLAKYGVAVFLAAFASFSGFSDEWYDGVGIPVGGFNCVPVGDPYQGSDGKWYVRLACSGKQNFETQVEFRDNNTNSWGSGSGSCTNCVKMTPDECLQMKSSITMTLDASSLMVDVLLKNQDDATIDVMYIRNLIEQLRAEGDQFGFYDFTPSSTQAQSQLDSLSATGIYQYPGPSTPTVLNLVRYCQGSNNGIYNYYNDSVKPVLDEMDTYTSEALDRLETIREEANFLKNDFNAVKTTLDGVSCAACSVGSGSGGDTITGGECYALEAAQVVIDFLRDYLDNLRDKVASIDSNLSKHKKEMSELSVFLKSALSTVAQAGTNFVYATEYKNLDGVSYQMRQLDELLKSNESQGFDFGEFGNLTWFARIEYLLASIAGVYSVTNSPDDLSENKMQSTYEQIAGQYEFLNQSVYGVQSRFEDLHTSLRSFYHSFGSGFGSLSSSGKIFFFSGWIGDQALEIQIDSTLLQGCRVITSLVWTVGATMILYGILFWGWKFFTTAVWFWVRGTTAFVR